MAKCPNPQGCSGDAGHTGYCRDYEADPSCPLCHGTKLCRTGDRMNPFGLCRGCQGTGQVQFIPGPYGGSLEPKCPDPCTFSSLGYACPVHKGPTVTHIPWLKED